MSEGDRECEGCTSVAIAARYWITFFVFSVFPAPDSPLIYDHELIVPNAPRRIEDSRNEDTLILPLFAHIDPRTLCNSKNVWRVLISSFIAVLLNN